MILLEAIRNIERELKGLRTDISKLHRLRNSLMTSQMNIEIRMLMRYEEMGKNLSPILRIIKVLEKRKKGVNDG